MRHAGEEAWGRTIMAMTARLVGGLMMVYAGVYLAQYLFSALYENPQRVWDVMNVISAVGVLTALGVNFVQLRRQSNASVPPGVGARSLFYASALLAIWFFHNWIRLLTLAEGESTTVYHNVVWQLIGGMLPLVFATTGWRLWSKHARGNH